MENFIEKEDLVKYLHMPYSYIANVYGCKESHVVDSLVYYGLFRGKIYKSFCLRCGSRLSSHEKIKYCDDLDSCSKKGYIESQNLKSGFVSKVKKEPGFVDIIDINNLADKKTYCVVTWKSGIKHIVEFIENPGDYNDVCAYIQEKYKRFETQGYSYRPVVNPVKKRDSWVEFHTSNGVVNRRSKEWLIMQNAVLWASQSTSTRRKVGAVISSLDKRCIYSHGFNGDEVGGPNIPRDDIPGDDGFIHAEENAMYKLKGSFGDVALFCTHMPCLSCSRKIINSGCIKEVYFLTPYTDTTGVGLMMKSGINVYHFVVENFDRKEYNSLDAINSMVPRGCDLINCI